MLLAADSANGFSVAAGQRHVRQRLFALSTAVACVLRHRMLLLSGSKQSSSSTSGDRGGTRWAPPPSHLGVLSSTCYADQPLCVSSLKNGVSKVILAQPKCVLMRAKRGERAACARTGYPTSSPPGGLSSRTHAELQLHCGRNGLLAVGFSSGSSALKICSILII